MCCLAGRHLHLVCSKVFLQFDWGKVAIFSALPPSIVKKQLLGLNIHVCKGHSATLGIVWHDFTLFSISQYQMNKSMPQ